MAAVLLVLGVTGTLSDWTSAIVTNSQNSVATAKAVILSETDGTSTCVSSANTTNSATCATINKFGGTATPLVPSGSQSATVTFTNAGQAAAASLSLTPGTCSQTPVAGTGSPPAADLCAASNTDLTLAVSCVDGSTYTGTPWTDLAYNGALSAFTATLTHTPGMAAGAAATCRFTVGLSTGASPTDEGITVSEALTWTLTKSS